MSFRTTTETNAADLYLDLLKKCLTRELLEEPHQALEGTSGQRWKRALLSVSQLMLSRTKLELVRNVPFDREARMEGRDWPIRAETMVGRRRLDNIEYCVSEVLSEGIPGDLMETGVWRGGSVILMRAILKAYCDVERTVWVADSFRGLPPPDPARYPQDLDDRLFEHQELAISIEEVKANFERYGLLDGQVRFLPGWFDDTLPNAPVDRLAVLRLDGDMYQSTIVALDALYPRLSVGGFVIIDDYGAMASCRAAVADYRKAKDIDDPIEIIDWSGVFWRRTR